MLREDLLCMVQDIDQELDDLKERTPLKINWFGNEYLDAATGGMSEEDLVILGSPTGAGKTELVTNMATTNAKLGRRVVYFALEAFKNEIVLRAKFKIMSQLLVDNNIREPFYYRDWARGNHYNNYRALQNKADMILRNDFETLRTFYRSTGKFGIEDLSYMVEQLVSTTDMFIIDHLHYFDFDDMNENRAIKETLKTLRDLVLVHKKTIVLVAHMRKKDKVDKGFVSDISDFHGSSDITKIATQCVTFGSYYGEEFKNNKINEYATIFNVGKNRTDGSVTKFAGFQNFDVYTNSYSKNFYISKISHDKTKIEPIDSQEKLPYWAKRSPNVKLFTAQQPTSPKRCAKDIKSGSENDWL